MRPKTLHLLILFFLVAVPVSPRAIPAAEKAEVQSLEQAANDPTASLMSVQIQNLYSGAYHNLSDGSGNTILLRSAVPFTTGNLNHIARGTLPVVTDSPSGENGLGDLVLFDLLAFDKSWGRRTGRSVSNGQ